MINFPVLSKISELLKKNNLDYMIIGGQAVLVYGISRFTDDIDIVINTDIRKLELLNHIFNNSGFEKLQNDEFTKKTFVFPLLDNDSKMRIDIIFSFSEFENEAISRAQSRMVSGTLVKYASIEDVIIMKIFAGRAVDLDDVRKLLIINKGIDKNYILKWLEKFDEDPELDITEKFKKILESI